MMNRELHVLVAEDSEEDARLLARELRVGGYEVIYKRIETARELKEALAAEVWDIILCDYAFPRFSGEDALRIVKESGLDVPFIFVSGRIGENTAVQAMKAGAHDYVMKNNLARLAAAVKRELGEAQMRKESRRAEEMMRSSEHKYRHLFESMRDAAFLVAEDNGIIIDVNPQAEVLIDRPRAEIIGMNQRELYPPGTGQPPLPVPPVAATGEDADSYEVEIARRNGSLVPTDVRVSRLQLYGRNLLLLLFRDMTKRLESENELRHSREQLRAFAARLQAVREEERTRVAREIHDELGQLLTALKMDLRWMENDLERLGDPRLNPILDRAVSATEVTDTLVKSVQRIAAELRPGILDRLGLQMALAHEAEQFEHRTGIPCQVTTPEEDALLPTESVTAVFRIFQEAMTNVARHANATNVQIEFQLQPGLLFLEVRDNGKGITAADLAGNDSLGLLGMKERARQLGGDVTIKAGVAGGTAVTTKIPYEPTSKAPCLK